MNLESGRVARYDETLEAPVRTTEEVKDECSRSGAILMD